MKKKIIAMFLAFSLTLSMVACGETSEEATDTAAISSDAIVEETVVLEGASVDFEDGNIGFLSEVSALKDGDPSELGITEYKGSNALTTTNVYGKSEVYIGLDMQALLGDRVADVKTIQFDIGAAGESFYAVSGKVYAYTGAELTENKLGSWSVYLETDNPKTVQYTMPVSFEAGADNYIIISKESDSATDVPSGGEYVPTEIAIDNIGFFDADGNLIEADTTATIGSSSPLIPAKEEALVYGRYVRLESTYAGDWAGSEIIAPEYFDCGDQNVTVTVNYKLEDGYDYYLIAPCINKDGWPKLEADDYADLVVATEGTTYHLQEDGFIVIDDQALESLSLTVTADACKDIVAGGGLLFQVYGVACQEAVVSDSVHNVGLTGVYGGDWGAAGAVPGEVFAGTDGPVNVTVNYKLEDGYDYYLIAPIIDTDGWPKLEADDYVDLVPSTEGATYHLQDDGFIVIDDWSRNSLSFTVTADAADRIAAGGGLNFQVYGVTGKNAIVSDSTYHAGMEGTYVGDWSAGNAIPGAIFEDRDSMMGVTVDFNIEAGYDYYLIAPCLNTDGWPKLAAEDYVDLTVAESGTLYHLQDDGFIVIDDWSIDSICFTVTADAAKKISENGGLVFQVFGVTCQDVTVSTCQYMYLMSGTYAGDWAGTLPIPAAFFEDAENMITVTPYFELQPGYEYYVFGPARNDNGWPKFTDFESYYVGVFEEENGLGRAYHFQGDGFISIEDWAINHVTFTLSPEGAKKVANQNGLLFQVMGETVKYVTIIR